MIELVHLRKEYDNVLAVDDLTLNIPQGEIFGLIGPNGVGKTTTIRIACGLLAPTLGRALIVGVDVAEESERAQQNIGYLSDFFAVYEDLKVWEYLDYFAHAYKMPEADIPARITEVIAQVNLEVKRDAMNSAGAPEGLASQASNGRIGSLRGRWTALALAGNFCRRRLRAHESGDCWLGITRFRWK